MSHQKLKSTGTLGTLKRKARAAAWMPIFLDVLRGTCNVKLSCIAAGVGRTTAYRHQSENPKFAEQWLDAIDDAVDVLEAEARRRAFGVDRDVWYKGKVVGQEVEYSDNLLMFLLKSHRPEKYRDNYDAGKIAGR